VLPKVLAKVIGLAISGLAKVKNSKKAVLAIFQLYFVQAAV
jgi:hypothetical protein